MSEKTSTNPNTQKNIYLMTMDYKPHISKVFPDMAADAFRDAIENYVPNRVLGNNHKKSNSSKSYCLELGKPHYH